MNVKKYKICIVDDEPLGREMLKEMLLGHTDLEICGEAANGKQAIELCQRHKPDLVFMDIRMPGITGIECASLLEPGIDVIFVSAYDQYAIAAFDAAAADYLLKPVEPKRFDLALARWRERRQQRRGDADYSGMLESERNRVVVKEGENIIILPVPEIPLMEARDDYVKIFHGDSVYLKKGKIGRYEELWSGLGFVRVHRSYLVQRSFITHIRSIGELELKNGMKVPVSRSGMERLG